MFKVGDFVECVDAPRIENSRLTNGEIYEVRPSPFGDGHEFIYLIDDSGELGGWHPNRFKKADLDVEIPGIGKIELRRR